MSKILVTILAISLSVFSSQAQVERKHDNTTQKEAHMGRGNDGMKMHHDHMMMKNMQFTDDQKQQLKSIHMDYKTRMGALEKNDNMSMKDYKAQKEVLIQERKSKMEALLTPDQKAQFESMKQQHMQKGNKKERMGKLKELGLSKDQLAQLKTKRQANKAKMESIKSDQSLTDDQKKAQMKILKESNMESFKSVLTPEQLNKLETEKTNK